jgi:hypothetical protein
LLRESLANAKPLLTEIVLHNELSNQTNRNQLYSNDDHRDAEQEQEGTLTEWRLEEPFFNNEVHIRSKSEYCEQRAHSAEKV